MAANLDYSGFGYFRDYIYLLTVPLNLYLHVPVHKLTAILCTVLALVYVGLLLSMDPSL